jgi:hypothetical protein
LLLQLGDVAGMNALRALCGLLRARAGLLRLFEAQHAWSDGGIDWNEM